MTFPFKNIYRMLLQILRGTGKSEEIVTLQCDNSERNKIQTMYTEGFVLGKSQRSHITPVTSVCEIYIII